MFKILQNEYYGLSVYKDGGIIAKRGYTIYEKNYNIHTCSSFSF
jgi:hypothetical protein